MTKVPTSAHKIRRVAFHATKYGKPLLVDAAMISDMPTFDTSPQPYSLDFYDILLVTKGRGTFALDDKLHKVVPGVVLFTRPGEVRQWRASGLDGACIFFAADFVREAFSDPQFMETFSFFREERPSGALTLSARQKNTFLKRFSPMARELKGMHSDTPHLLRAALYETLVLLNRWYVQQHGEIAPQSNSTLKRFLAHVERDYRKQHRVNAYASHVGRTPGHLSFLCREAFGLTAGAVIQQRIALEAKRMLLYTDANAATIGYALGFNDPAYFSRFFRRLTGTSPQEFRRRI